MSEYNVHKMVSSLTSAINNEEKIMLPLLIAKLVKYNEAYPDDHTIGSISNIVENMSLNDKFSIKRAELKNLYNKFYSKGTKFAELFKDELGEIKKIATQTFVQKDESVKDMDPYQYGDQVLSNALDGVFDNTIAVKMYSKSIAKKAVESVNMLLNSIKLKASLEVDNGNDKFIIIKAKCETPKGLTSFLIPLEINHNNVFEPSYFITNAGVQDLNKVNIKKHILDHTGENLKIRAEHVLNLLKKSSFEDKEISNVELALIRLNSKRGSEFGGQILGQKISQEAVADITLPKSDEFKSFEDQFGTPAGEAEMLFGNKTTIAKDGIIRELKSFGYNNIQIKILKADKSRISYGVNIGTKAFIVPVKINNNKIIKPNLIICNGSISDFSNESILELNNDFKVAAATSLYSSMHPAKLIEVIKEAAIEGNFAKAEDSLNVLAGISDNDYTIGFLTYLNNLNAKKAEVKCNKTIKTANSEHLICSHTGLTVHKTYVDEFGSCRPLYRSGMSNTYEVANINSNKIFG